MQRVGFWASVGLAAIACSVVSLSQALWAGESEEVTVKRQVEPRYPVWAYNHGVSEGFAKLAFYVDEQGAISELLPIEYSHVSFAEELTAAVLKWEFRPATKNGRPIKSVVHAHWEFLPNRPIETNALFDTSKRIESMRSAERRELKYRDGSDLDERIGMLGFPGLMVQVGDSAVEAGLESVRARVSFFVRERGEVALPKVVDSSHPELDARLEAALKGASFAIPVYDGKPTLALLERTYDFPIVWVEEAVAETL